MMRKITFAFLFLFLSLNVISSESQWVPFGKASPEKSKPGINVLSNDQSEITLQLAGFYKEERQTPAGKSFSITFPGGAKMLQAGMPDLPQASYSLIIPDNAEMKVEVVSFEYTDFHISIAPSKGNLKRNIDPSLIPFTFSSAYSTNAFYPGNLTSLRDPYIIRDFRGQTVVLNPFQYNPVTQTLRVYYSLKVKISPTGNSSSTNQFRRRAQTDAVDGSYSAIYSSHFLNYSVQRNSPQGEYGNMLVIADSSLMSTMQPFVDWKNRMGQFTEMVDVQSIGDSVEAIKSFIADYYNDNGLTFVLLVGDAPAIPPYHTQYGDSDPAYGYISGNDSYAEVIVGRFSANNVDELETQVKRTLTYEMYPDPAGEWYHKGVCIGSDQGPGDDNEYDFEHERNIRTDLMGYNYTLVDELFDGSQSGVDAPGNPTDDDLNASLNDGRSFVTYTGHGSSVLWGTTGYGLHSISGLTNVNKLPFIWSVACGNGDFRAGTCLGEGLMRASFPNGDPVGAIAALMSTINQSWDPPMDGQDEMVDQLVESYPGSVKHTFGNISLAGCTHMNDQYGTDGAEITDTWLIFGDPSLTVRTNTPAPLNASVPANIYDDAESISIYCQHNGALACLSKDNQIVSTGMINNGGVNLLIGNVVVGDTLDLVITAYNSIPTFAKYIVRSVGSDTPFSFFPNPAHGKINFTFPPGIKTFSVQLINSIGQKTTIRIVRENNSYEADVSGLAAGVYAAVIFNGDQTLAVKKIVIQ